MYDAIKLDVFQLPFKKTGKPATRVIMVAPMKPTQAAYGWKGPFQGSESRDTPCAFIAAWKRM